MDVKKTVLFAQGNGDLGTYIKTGKFSCVITIANGSSSTATIPISTPGGYKAVLAVIIDTGQAKIIPRSCWISSGSEVTVYVDNLGGSSYSGTIFVSVLFAHEP